MLKRNVQVQHLHCDCRPEKEHGNNTTSYTPVVMFLFPYYFVMSILNMNTCTYIIWVNDLLPKREVSSITNHISVFQGEKPPYTFFSITISFFSPFFLFDPLFFRLSESRTLFYFFQKFQVKPSKTWLVSTPLKFVDVGIVALCWSFVKHAVCGLIVLCRKSMIFADNIALYLICLYVLFGRFCAVWLLAVAFYTFYASFQFNWNRIIGVRFTN